MERSTCFHIVQIADRVLAQGVVYPFLTTFSLPVAT